ncbi:MAG: response regulator [Thermodesulfobacteriota bacterium]|jgi:CheY-like chemotaxis protein
MGEDKVRILIVDDEYAFCKTLRLYLAKLGYETIIATNGEHALDLIKEEQPRVMTLDIRMPGMDGYEVLNHAKRLNQELFIIVITAIDVPRMEELLERSGAHAVLRKPISLEELRETIARHLEGQGK